MQTLSFAIRYYIKMILLKISKLISLRLIGLIYLYLLLKTEANLRSCRLASQDYAFQLVPKLHSCHREFLLIASNGNLADST